jgi:CubicO group peptidase (beta-lactamase class C family)
MALTCALNLTILPAAPLRATDSSNLDSSDVERAAAAIERQLEEMGVGQAAYAVVNGDEQVIAGHGAASPDTPFVIGSVSKSFTALAILQLVDRGLVDLDSPITDHLDWFTTADPTALITIRHLLNQTSGFSTLDGTRSVFTPKISLEERVRSIEDYGLVSQPGSEFNYSNLNYAILGLIVQEVSGLDYGAYVEEEIFGPLGMEHSHSDLAGGLADGMAQGTITIFGIPVALRQAAFPGAVPDGYLISTASDLAEYARFQMGDGSFEGGQLISGENMALMHTPVAPSQGRAHLDHYAMGWRTGSIDGHPLISHDGNTFGYHANVAVLPDLDAAVVVIMGRNGVVVTGPETKGLEALIGGAPGVSRASTIAWVAIDAVTALLVLASIVFVVRRRRRSQSSLPRTPRRWPAVLQIAAGVGIGVAVIFLVASMFGGLDIVAFRLFWSLAPDVTIVAVAIPLLLIAAGIATLMERRALRKGPTQIRRNQGGPSNMSERESKSVLEAYSDLERPGWIAAHSEAVLGRRPQGDRRLWHQSG